MTGLDIFDRYDLAMSLVMGALIGVALDLNAPLWVPVLIMFVTSVIGFIRHFDEFMEP